MTGIAARIALLAAIGITGLGAVSAAYRLPESKPAALPDDPGSQLVEANCSGCHSLDYILTQPRGKPAAFWRDAVTKMVNVYGAPIDKPDGDRIAAYLARHYGAP